MSFYSSRPDRFVSRMKEAKEKRGRPEGELGGLSAKLARGETNRDPPILSRGNENRGSEKTREEDALLCSLSGRESHWKRAPRRKYV